MPLSAGNLSLGRFRQQFKRLGARNNPGHCSTNSESRMYLLSDKMYLDIIATVQYARLNITATVHMYFALF